MFYYFLNHPRLYVTIFLISLCFFVISIILLALSEFWGEGVIKNWIRTIFIGTVITILATGFVISPSDVYSPSHSYVQSITPYLQFYKIKLTNNKEVRVSQDKIVFHKSSDNINRGIMCHLKPNKKITPKGLNTYKYHYFNSVDKIYLEETNNEVDLYLTKTAKDSLSYGKTFEFKH